MFPPVKGKLLVHACCCHCGAYTLLSFRDEGYAVSAFWYNPNIHPFLEHEARRQALVTLTGRFEIPVITVDGYDMPDYFRRVAGHEDERCVRCYEMRLAKTAEVAIAQGFDAFSSSLLISPWQKHALIKAAGERIAAEKGIPFIYADLRKHYSDSRRITKPLDLYRQQYCGCVYSEWERYRGEKPKVDLFSKAIP
jgi:predicted adenine nucleotide alpha hydrolase (AANH) superfamily ATPase